MLTARIGEFSQPDGHNKGTTRSGKPYTESMKSNRENIEYRTTMVEERTEDSEDEQRNEDDDETNRQSADDMVSKDDNGKRNNADGGDNANYKDNENNGVESDSEINENNGNDVRRNQPYRCKRHPSAEERSFAVAFPCGYEVRKTVLGESLYPDPVTALVDSISFQHPDHLPRTDVHHFATTFNAFRPQHEDINMTLAQTLFDWAWKIHETLTRLCIQYLDGTKYSITTDEKEWKAQCRKPMLDVWVQIDENKAEYFGLLPKVLPYHNQPHMTNALNPVAPKSWVKHRGQLRYFDRTEVHAWLAIHRCRTPHGLPWVAEPCDIDTCRERALNIFDLVEASGLASIPHEWLFNIDDASGVSYNRRVHSREDILKLDQREAEVYIRCQACRAFLSALSATDRALEIYDQQNGANVIPDGWKIPGLSMKNYNDPKSWITGPQQIKDLNKAERCVWLKEHGCMSTLKPGKAGFTWCQLFEILRKGKELPEAWKRKQDRSHHPYLETQKILQSSHWIEHRNDIFGLSKWEAQVWQRSQFCWGGTIKRCFEIFDNVKRYGSARIPECLICEIPARREECEHISTEITLHAEPQGFRGDLHKAEESSGMPLKE
ncbi:hypothetical protein MMC10_008445 [Thelotrema lepadinum]|nr:hypothetical protein [Thelotrema lepadinum]